MTPPGRAAAVSAAVPATLSAVFLSVLLSACAAVLPAGSSPVAATRAPETPVFATDLARVCADGLGFPGSPAYRRAPGNVQPAVLMDREDGTWSQDAPRDGDVPRGWILGYGDDVAKAPLVICQETTGTRPNGTTCAMKDRDTGKPFTVTLYDTSYRVRVREIRTGRTLATREGMAKAAACPMFTFTRQGEDRTKHYAEPGPAAYRKLLKRWVAPS